MERHSEQLTNDHYRHCHGTEQVWKYFGDIVITDGIKEVAEKEECFWFLDVICSYQSQENFKNARYQKWKLERIEDTQFLVTASNLDNGEVMATQEIEFSDFFFRELIMLKKDNVILLPSED